MSLAQAFTKANNLKDLTQSWIKHATAKLKESGRDSEVRLTVDNVASLVAPAALVADLITKTELGSNGPGLRVLLLGADPMIRIDQSKWASMAGDMLGRHGRINILTCFEPAAPTEFSSLASQLGLPAADVISHAQLRECGASAADLVIWFHPVAEARSSEETEIAETATQLAKTGLPVFSVVFNLTDMHAQNALLHDAGVRMTPIGDSVERGSLAINRFGISTKGIGIEGGWGAIITCLHPCEPYMAPQDVAVACAALQLRCIEGAIHSAWQLGQPINGVAFNRIIPVGLIGNLAVDPSTGHLFSEDGHSKQLQLVGHVWRAKQATMPESLEQLLVWACDLKLSSQLDLPKEPKKRVEAIELLTSAFNSGVVAAGIGLARCYERSQSTAAKADALYQQIGEAHPLSAYHLAHVAIGKGQQNQAERYLRCAASFGYPVAQTDLGKLLYSTGRVQEAMQYLQAASDGADIEANFVLGELLAQAGSFAEALGELRKAWTYGHHPAAELAALVAQHMLENSIGKRSWVKREHREVSGYLAKLERLGAKEQAQ